MAGAVTRPVLAAAAALIFAAGCSSQARKPSVPPAPCVGTLGIEAGPLSAAERKRLALPAEVHGAVVREVLPGGPGAKAGVQPGDVVEKIGDTGIANVCDFDAAAYNRPCQPVRVVVRRSGAEVEVMLAPEDQAALFRRGCDAGFETACFREGWLLWKRSGGTEANQSRALVLFSSSCGAGSAEACAYESLALMDVPDRGGDALAAATRACELENGAGCANLAFLYVSGNVVAKDTPRAAKLYEKSCGLGDAQGCYNAGLMADDGRGAHQDHAVAAARYGEACELGSPMACTNLGFLYERGRGVKADPARALALYQRGCDGSRCQPSNLGGCVNAGRAYRDGIGTSKDEAKAAEIFRDACDRKPEADDLEAAENGSRACSLLGALYLAGDGIPKDLTQGRELSEQGCERGDSFGCFNAAAVYGAGAGVPADAAKAASYLDRACQAGDGEGCNDLAAAYEKGNGVARDPRRAMELRQRACELGFTDACAKPKPKPKKKSKP